MSPKAIIRGALLAVVLHASAVCHAAPALATAYTSSLTWTLERTDPVSASSSGSGSSTYVLDLIGTNARYDTSASAYANLSTGKLGVQSQMSSVIQDANGNFLTSNFGGRWTDTGARASFRDTLNFNVSGGDSSSVTILEYAFRIDGLLGDMSSAAFLYSFDNHSSQFNPLHDYAYGSRLLRSGGTSLGGGDTQKAVGSTFGLSGSVVYDPVSNRYLVDRTYHGTIVLYGANPVLDIAIDMEAYGYDADFSHTGAFQFSSVPAGVTWTSQSGVFLAGPGNSVSEPNTLIPLVLSFVALFCLPRMRTSHKS